MSATVVTMQWNQFVGECTARLAPKPVQAPAQAPAQTSTRKPAKPAMTPCRECGHPPKDQLGCGWKCCGFTAPDRAAWEAAQTRTQAQAPAPLSLLTWAKSLTRPALVVYADDQSDPP